ncbi:MAG: ImmA/IrrE family metallo-endopeptidase [Oscillospiraceae bacterium]|jgi:hypothetical protein|nr:ImmA/IrrE family metallo-endopeptidase [Oscillospiraceae bacterium]
MALLSERSESVADLACETLLDCHVHRLPVDVIELTRRLQIKVINNQEVDKLGPEEYGAGYFDGKSWYIVYAPCLPVGGIRFTIAHELGHILLKHTPADGIPAKEKEEEADLFAARLLAPPGILRELNAYSASSISLLCNLSRSCAEMQSKTMVNLHLARRPEPSGAEKKLIAAFGDYIENNRLREFRTELLPPRENSAGKLYRAVNTRTRRKPSLDIEEKA